MILLSFLLLAAIFVSEACPVGFYGWSCDKKCSEFCGGNGACGKYTGFCSSGCLPKYWGFECDKACSRYCAGSGKCNRYTSFCDDGCKPGSSTYFCF
ncbi:multiple epidermal growth factor-like domains protein 6 isoform X2 [Saccostrea cucullata]|uniref:multiple epidermal growth factor-like domains protein 6 isoform X2 n=1 Tax=Saccostrea cuccullata TaxID=36930 RepID=UPI002ED1B4F3